MGLFRFAESLGLKPINQDRFNRCLKNIRYALLTEKNIYVIKNHKKNAFCLSVKYFAWKN